MKKLLIAILFILLIYAAFAQKTKSEATILSGPMAAYTECRETAVWLQTTEPAEVKIQYWKKGKPDSSVTTRAQYTKAEDFNVATFVINLLEPGTTYEYQVLVNKKAIKFAEPLYFKTQEVWWYRKDPPDFTVAFGSCVYINEPKYDRYGKGYGLPSDKIFNSIADKKPDLMLWIGDNTYIRQADFGSRSGILYRYTHTRSHSDLQRLLRTGHHYGIWDDHDYGPNDADVSNPFKETSLEIFKMFFPKQKYGLPNAPGIFYRFTYSDVDFFMLDDRFYRSPSGMKDGQHKTQLGEEQLEWLKNSLLNSSAPFKIICVGGQFINEKTDKESFNLYRYEREKIINFIKENNIEGVVFLTGDRHHAELLRKEIGGFYPLYDFTSSPLTSTIHIVKETSTEYKNDQRIANTLIQEQNFGMLRFSGAGENRTMKMECYNAEGKLLWDFTLKTSDLKVKKEHSSQD